MSLVATYVKGSDGQYYKLPIFSGEVDGCRWFICYDDDDPIELVIASQDAVVVEEVKEGIKKLFSDNDCDISFSKIQGRSQRCFSANDWRDFHDAVSMWVEMKEPPVELITKHEGVMERGSIGQGVIYG